MYARQVNDKTLRFVVSGMLWRDSLVMVDLETKTYWSHLIGEAMHGALKGTELKQIASVMTSWKQWRSMHPKTTVTRMKRPPVPPDLNFTSDRTVGLGEMMMIGLVVKDQAYAWSFRELKSQVVVNDVLKAVEGPLGKHIVVVYDPENGTSVIRDRHVDGKTLQFAWKSGKLTDVETGSTWDLVTGTATTGPMKGKVLPLMPGIVSYTAQWLGFHPESIMWMPKAQ